MSTAGSPSPSPATSAAYDGPTSSRHVTVRRNKDNKVAQTAIGRRKRATDGQQPAGSRRRIREPSPNSTGSDSELSSGLTGSDRRPSPENAESDLENYDPDQPMDERREIQKSLREMQRVLHEHPEKLDGAEAFVNFYKETDELNSKIKQTAEAALEARGLVYASEQQRRWIQGLTQGVAGRGVDLDEFVSKVRLYMMGGLGIQNVDATELSSTQRLRRQPRREAIGSDDADEIGDDGDMMNWAHLGRYACMPSICRPPTTGFLLGPLSVEKKVRKFSKRSAPLRGNNAAEIRPQELRAEDLRQNEKSDLPSMVIKVHELLRLAREQALAAFQADWSAVNEEADEEADEGQDRELMEKHAIRSTGGLDLFKFVVNPHSFGQTVENLFYVSFLMKEGKIKLDFDKNGLPSLEPVSKERAEAEAAGRRQQTRHQAILSIDMSTWKEIIHLFGITKPMIPHREEALQTGPGARNWYT